MTHVIMVKQKFVADCGICCIAMATGVEYERVLMAAPIDEEFFEYGLTLQQVITTIRRLGKQARWHWPEKLSPNSMGVPLRERVRGRNAIHLVPSISKKELGAYHYVLVSNGQIFDPSPRGKQRYKRYEQLQPLGVVYQP